MKDKKEQKLNEGLCLEKFEICVPIDCRLLGEWHTPDLWKCYLRDLTGLDELPKEYATCPPLCWSCDCQLGWKLEGEWALKHACRIHDKIHRQALGLEQVTAIDVGFAISERQTRFWDFLAIRVHVNNKLPPEQLVRAGLVSLTETAFALVPRISSPRRGREGVVRQKRSDRLSHGIRDGLDQAGYADRLILPPWDHIPQPDPCDGLEAPEKIPCPCCPTTQLNCPHGERKEQLRRLLAQDERLGGREFREVIAGRYPITGIQREDLSVFCPKSIAQTLSLEDVRLCICGVPIDIVNAEYNAAITHPGGDADSGVFADAPKSSEKLTDEEQLLIGQGRVNPMVGGISVGTVTGQAGTLGVIVWDRTDGTACGLSNWHVLAGTPRAQVGQPTYQPALFDGGTQADVIGHLKRWHLGEEGDAALTELTGNRHYASGEVLGLWHPVSGSLKPRLNMEIRKWGRTTGFSDGFVDGVHLATNIDYGNGVVRDFRNQFHIAPLIAGRDVSRTGDSGSLVVTSFRPLDQQKSLAVLTHWLRQLCDSRGYAWLCKEVSKTVATWLNELCAETNTDGCSDSQAPKAENCPELCGFLKSMQETVEEFCCQASLPVPAPQESCCCFTRGCCEVSSCEGSGGSVSKTCICCECINRAFDEGNLAKRRKLLSDAIRVCPCCYLKVQVSELRRSCRGIREELNKYSVWERRIEVLLESCLVASVPEATVEAAIAKAVEDLNYPRCEDASLPFTCCDDLATLLRWIVCCRIRLENCVDFCDEVKDALEGWRDKCCAILHARAEAEKICYALHVCDTSKCKDSLALVECIKEEIGKVESKCKDPSSIRTCIEEEVKRNEGKSPVADTCGCSRKDGGSRSPLGGITTRNGSPPPVFDEVYREDLRKYGYEPTNIDDSWFKQLLTKELSTEEILNAILKGAKELLEKTEDEDQRDANRAYYAIGMIFAGDTPGSPFGEFAIASDIQRLAETLRFSLRPVFEPRSSFRELRERPQRTSRRRGTVGGFGGLTPGDTAADPRGGGPQPDPEPLQTGPGDRPDDS